MTNTISAPIHVCWNWTLRSRPEDIWPWISNTDRFNRDSAVPSVEQVGQARYRKQLSLEKLGVKVEWEEEPFEWVRPERFGVVRRYLRGPLAEMRVLAELGAGNLRYQVWATPRNALGRLIVRLQLMESARRFRATVRRYDAIAAGGASAESGSGNVEFTPQGKARLHRGLVRLGTAGMNGQQVERLGQVLEAADDRDVARMRPYAFADAWACPRREILELFLHAASLGVLELQWDLLCPLCRGAKQSSTSLDNVTSHVHCDACQIEFLVDFDRSVEATFRPDPKIRQLAVEQYCVGGPQTLPHIVVQQILPARSERILRVALEAGSYRHRRWGSTGGQPVVVLPGGGHEHAGLDPDSRQAVELSRHAEVRFVNESGEEQVVLLERMAWSDQAATAAEVTSLQVFRDLFGPDTLRPSEQIEVRELTVMFTNLHDATRICLENGDVAAFARVTQHFDALTDVISRHGGALVKTIGDGTMSVFRKPADAVRAANEAIHRLAEDPAQTAPLALKAGIHCGPMVAVTLNDRLDYFGATVNLASRLAEAAEPRHLLMSSAVAQNSETEDWLGRLGTRLESVQVGDTRAFRVPYQASA